MKNGHSSLEAHTYWIRSDIPSFITCLYIDKNRRSYIWQQLSAVYFVFFYMFDISLDHICFSCLDVSFIIFGWSCFFWIQIRKIAKNVLIKNRFRKSDWKFTRNWWLLWNIVLINNSTSEIASLNDFVFLPNSSLLLLVLNLKSFPELN